MAPEFRIDTPWPLDINAPGFHVLPGPNIGTITTFLANQPDGRALGVTVPSHSIDTLIEGFKTILLTFHLDSWSSSAAAHVATIQLHNSFIVEAEASQLRVGTGGRGRVCVYQPYNGDLVMAACQVWVAELVVGL
ncbi:hypothetical protein B0H19DRAFT_1076943 [Mycena capillaripes]|nr:hypothetical protein B0H19DRAFT_1076943 [Mycena capillaripes]